MIPMVQEGPAAQLAVAALADRIGPLLSHLPSLPRIVRYYDDFTDRWHTIHNYPTSRSLTITADGVNNVIDLSPFDHHVLHILRHALLHWFGRLDAKTIRTRLGSLLVDPSLANRAITTAASVSPADFRCAWIRWFDADAATQHGQWAALKQMLHSFCALSINEWTDEYEDFVRALPSPKVDIYAALRAGDCFIPVEHQGAVADYLDEMASIAKVSPATIDTELLRSICLLTLSFQHGVRPGQTARVKRDDVRIHQTGAVHIRFVMTKQHGKAQAFHTRRVKREWCPLFIEFGRRFEGIAVPENVHPEAFFRLTTRSVQKRIIAFSKKLSGETWSPGDWRHTGAQRLADAGASYEEIADFLMHAWTGTAKLYFDASASQAATVNRAMGLSQIYRGVEGVARTRKIDKAVLMTLPEDRQVGGVPHGIPIAGIGACGVGQSACVKNPVLSCYTCRKFLPVRDSGIHRQVADDLREVVHQFYKAGSEVGGSPAFGQLRQTIEAADRVAAEASDGEVEEQG